MEHVVSYFGIHILSFAELCKVRSRKWSFFGLNSEWTEGKILH